VLETGTPQLAHYTGSDIPLRYRAELDGRGIEIEMVPAESRRLVDGARVARDLSRRRSAGCGAHVRFVGSDTTLTLPGPVVKAGEYYFYDSL
jgi:hypothetical protein